MYTRISCVHMAGMCMSVFHVTCAITYTCIHTYAVHVCIHTYMYMYVYKMEPPKRRPLRPRNVSSLEKCLLFRDININVVFVPCKCVLFRGIPLSNIHYYCVCLCVGGVCIYTCTYVCTEPNCIFSPENCLQTS